MNQLQEKIAKYRRQIEFLESEIDTIGDDNDVFDNARRVEMKLKINEFLSRIERLEKRIVGETLSNEKIAQMEYTNRVMDDIRNGEYDEC